ncbi:MAG: carboxypeptidase-like regulatory domain-containing protein [Methanocellales archaeon]
MNIKNIKNNINKNKNKEENKNIEDKKTPTCKILGRVLSEDGSMLSAARVKCSPVNMEVITLFDGSYKLEYLFPGSYIVTASLKGFQSQSKNVILKENETAILDFKLPRAIGNSKIYGRVLDAETKMPVKTNVTLTLILPVTNRYAVTNKDAYYEFDKLPSDTYEIFAVPLDGYWEERAIVTLGESEVKKVDIFLKPKIIVEPPWG